MNKSAKITVYHPIQEYNAYLSKINIYFFVIEKKKGIVIYFQFTFVKVNLSGRSMPRVLVKGEVVRAEVLPRQ